MSGKQQEQAASRTRHPGSRRQTDGCGVPPHLRFAEETVSVSDFTVALCRMSEYVGDHGDLADFRLVAMTAEHWYQVARWTDLEGARQIAARLERPAERTHRLYLTYETRTANLTPELYRLIGKTTVSTSFMKVHWAPPGSAFQVGAEHDRPLDARHPRWVTRADLDADERRMAAIRPLWQPRLADADELSREVYNLNGVDEDTEATRRPRR